MVFPANLLSNTASHLRSLTPTNPPVREQEAMLIVKDTQNADLIEKLERSRAEHRRKRDDAAITQQQLEFFQKTVKRSVTKKKSEVGR